jgi:hypothetical protein
MLCVVPAYMMPFLSPTHLCFLSCHATNLPESKAAVDLHHKSNDLLLACDVANQTCQHMAAMHPAIQAFTGGTGCNT